MSVDLSRERRYRVYFCLFIAKYMAEKAMHKMQDIKASSILVQ